MTVSIKMTASQKAKLAALGGANWIRKMIDSALAPKVSDDAAGNDR